MAENIEKLEIRSEDFFKKPRRRRVYKDYYLSFQHKIVLNFDQSRKEYVSKFMASATKYCIHSRKHSIALPMLNGNEIKFYENKFHITLDIVKLTHLIETYNATHVYESIIPAISNNLTERDRNLFSASRYKVDKTRMNKMKPEWKAFRINRILDEYKLYKHSEWNKNEFLIFSWYLKDYLIPDRSRYVT